MLDELPPDLRGLLEHTNGFVAFQGGLHVRGVGVEPAWHSLDLARNGSESIHALFASVLPDDIPFAQDCLGDQFLLRNNVVHRLRAETAEVQNLCLALDAFFSKLASDPGEILELEPLLKFRDDGGTLAPGQLLNVYPPFVFEESATGVSLKAVPAREQLEFLSSLSKQLASLAEGQQVRLRMTGSTGDLPRQP